jgi:hypothetical protein
MQPSGSIDHTHASLSQTLKELVFRIEDQADARIILSGWITQSIVWISVWRLSNSGFEVDLDGCNTALVTEAGIIGKRSLTSGAQHSVILGFEWTQMKKIYWSFSILLEVEALLIINTAWCSSNPKATVIVE